MKIRFLSAIVFGLTLSLFATGQDAGPRGGMGGGMRGMGMGGGLMGTVTEVAADHYTIKTDAGDTYIVHFSANTHIMKQMARQGGEGGGNPPQMLKPSDIKVGDAVGVMGDVDAAAKSVGAMWIAQLDPERAKQMREMQANYGKTWLMGKVTAINETKIALMGAVDNTAHTFVVDENTTFRKRREPITLADVQVGDVVRAEGAVKDGVFAAATVSVMGMPMGGSQMVPRAGGTADTPQPNAPAPTPQTK
jgi:preprotein translocase subunit YajC